ncbi:somatostatin receptor type 4-like [Mya arenaria]|uniref:somatostatin receptor type 4-like n=1 Tax=Mya arenaria TaxID=6604 RepID=UPI0022E90019|nr:somatostatin receptor type 4-like [Mya arenaria]
MEKDANTTVMKQCGICDTKCVYSAIETTFMLGVVSNLLIVYIVVKEKRLHDPTLIGIAGLAVSDAIFLFLRLLKPIEEVIRVSTCENGTDKAIGTKWYYSIRTSAWAAANTHVAMLAVIRYITLVYPIKSHLILTIKRILLASFWIWLFSLAFVGTLSVLMAYNLIPGWQSHEYVLILWTCVYIMPVTVTTILHWRKVILVRRSANTYSTDRQIKNIRRMSKLVILVVILATVLPLPRFINKILIAINMNRRLDISKEFLRHFKGVSDILFLVNHSINPILYGFLSQRVRKSLQKVFCKIAVHNQRSDRDRSGDRSSENRGIGVNPKCIGDNDVKTLCGATNEGNVTLEKYKRRPKASTSSTSTIESCISSISDVV